MYSDCPIRSMKPGATTRPRASRVRRAPAGSRWGAMAAMRSPLMARSPSTHGLPVPSTILPPCSSRS
ncbi:MAG: hypothetical protein DMF50_09150 [Acidobacteria bacterium]|nr:MAG: hypothetical protein DMF50_09150 [Acidobacteriota bacterium]